MSRSQEELVALLSELAELTTLDEGSPQSFRVRAYENATVELKAYRGDLSELSESQLTKLDGIGKSTAKKIREYYDTGTISKLEALREKFPPSYVQLSRVPGLGPKTLVLLRKELGVESVADLKQAIDQQKLRELKGLGAKSEEKLARALERIGSKQDRRPIGEALPLAEALLTELGAMPQVEKLQYCGSLRRMRETIADVDIVVASADPGPIMDYFVKMGRVTEILGHGETKSSVVTSAGIQVDLRVVEPESYGAAILYFTGSKTHNIALRQRAIDRGMTLNEYGLASADGSEIIASETEEEIYEKLGLAFIPPEMREDRGEIEAAEKGELPEFAGEEDLRGDLHVHTDRSGDARAPLADIVARASELGYQYLAITDHGEDLALNGVARADLEAQHDEIRELQKDYSDLRILFGCELNIGADGELDYDDEFRAGFDFCLAGVHSHFDLDDKAQTKRLLRAIECPQVNAIAHLSGRLIGKRPGISFDVDAVLTAAAETRTAIEINSHLSRLDAEADVLIRAAELGCLFAINSDAHSREQVRRLGSGVRHARRGWIPAASIVNTWPQERFLDWVRSSRQD